MWSQFTEYKFNVILAPEWTSSSFFPGANASEEIALSTHGRWGEFTLTLGYGRGNIEKNRVSDWGTVNVQRSTIAARQSRASLHAEEDLSEPCSRYLLVDIQQ